MDPYVQNAANPAFTYSVPYVFRWVRRSAIFNSLTWLVIIFLLLREIYPEMHEKLIVIYYIIDYAVIPFAKWVITIIVSFFREIGIALTSGAA